MDRVEDWLEPVELKPSVLRFPGRPDRLAYPDHREAGLHHQLEVGLQVGAVLVLGVVWGAEANPVHQASLPRYRKPAKLTVPSDAYRPMTRPVKDAQVSAVQSRPSSSATSAPPASSRMRSPPIAAKLKLAGGGVISIRSSTSPAGTVACQVWARPASWARALTTVPRASREIQWCS